MFGAPHYMLDQHAGAEQFALPQTAPVERFCQQLRSSQKVEHAQKFWSAVCCFCTPSCKVVLQGDYGSPVLYVQQQYGCKVGVFQVRKKPAVDAVSEECSTACRQ